MENNKTFLIGLGLISFLAISTRLLSGESYFDAEDVLDYALKIKQNDVSAFDKAGSGWQLLCLLIKSLLPATAAATLPGEILSKLAGVFSLILMYGILARITGQVLIASLVTLIYAGSFAPWWYSLQPDKYVPQLAFQALALAMILTTKGIPSMWRLISLGGIFALAILIHSASGLVCLAMLPLSWRMLKQNGWVFALSRSIFVAVCMCICLAIYYGFFLSVFVKTQNISEAIQWLMSYTAEPTENRLWGHWQLKSIILSLIGLSRAIFTTEFLFGLPEVMLGAQNTFPAKIFVEEQWLGQTFQLWALKAGALLLGCSIIMIVIVALGVINNLLKLNRSPSWRFGYEIAVITCYLLPACLFFTWWEPSNNEFWISPWYAICLLSGFILANFPSKTLHFLLGLAGLSLFLVNGIFGILPRTKAKNDFWIETETTLANQAKQGDLILEHPYIAANYAEYLSNAQVFKLLHHCENQQSLADAMRHYFQKNNIKDVYLGPIANDISYGKTPLYPTLTACDQQVSEFISKLLPQTEKIEVEGKTISRISSTNFQNWLSKQ